MSISNYIVHIHARHKWHTRNALGRTFGEAAKRAVSELNKEIPHGASFKRHATYAKVTLYETSVRDVFPGLLRPSGLTSPGDVWISYVVREGKLEDCLYCGGTGQCHYNLFLQCAQCGQKNPDGSQKKFPLMVIEGAIVPANITQSQIRAVKREQRAKRR